MAQISAADVSKLRKTTGAGMMDCKKALQEAEGDFDKAIEIIRKKGQAIANKRADRDASEGVVIAKVTDDTKQGAIISLNCETDFVAKNENFINLAYSILDLAIANMPASLDELKGLDLNGRSVAEIVLEQNGIIGEKIELTYYENIASEYVIAYVHPGNRLSTLVGFNQNIEDIQVAKDVAMQIAAMAPVAIDKSDVPQEIVDKEIEIGKEQAKLEGKPEELSEKIAMGKLNKFFKESTLLNQDFTKNNKQTIKQYLQETNKDLTVTKFFRYTLNN